MVVVRPPEVPRSAPPDPDAGVIEDARRRQRLHRLATLAVLLAAAAVAVIVYVARAGGDPARVTVPPPGVATGSLHALPASAYEFWMTPTLWPTLPPRQPSVDVTIQFRGGGGESCVGGCSNYVGAGMPIGLMSNDATLAQPRLGAGRNVMLFVAPNVAAVRVGIFGTIGALMAPGLPAGDKLVAFSLPQGRRLPQTPIELTALDSSGSSLLTPQPPRDLGQTMPQALVSDGACRVTSTLAGLNRQQAFASPHIIASAPTTPGLFVSCLEAKYAYQGSKFNVAILLDAHRPGRQLAPLWNAHSIPGHPGILQIKPPPYFAANQDTSAPLYARRAGNAWLVVQARPGFAPNPTVATRLKVLDSIHITRLDP